MIIRVLNEGQYEVAEPDLRRLNELDVECQAAVDADDSASFHSCYAQLLDLLRASGSALADEDLRPSDLMLPPSDVSLEEARGAFSEHGLIPD